MMIRVYQIVMQQNAERVALAAKMRAECFPKLPVTVVPACLPPDDPHEFLKPVEVGCAISHATVHAMVRNDLRLGHYALILEDDVESVDFGKVWKVATHAGLGWGEGQVIQLGDTADVFSKDYFNEPVLKEFYGIQQVTRWPFTTHCYLIDKKGAEYALTQNNPPRAQSDVLFYIEPDPKRYVPGGPKQIARLRCGLTPGIAKVAGLPSLIQENTLEHGQVREDTEGLGEPGRLPRVSGRSEGTQQ